MKSHRTFDTLTQAAKALNTTPAKLKALKRQGAAGFRSGRVDEAGLLAWLKANPPAKKAMAPLAIPEKIARGAAAALSRLELVESELYTRMAASGDPEDRKAWLAVSEQLRRHDLAVEASRREVDVLPRAVVEETLARLTWAWRICIANNTDSRLVQIQRAAVGPIEDLAAEFDKLAQNEFLNAVVGYAEMFAVPGWLKVAMVRGLDFKPEDIENRAQAFRAASAAATGDISGLEQLRKGRAGK